MSDFPATPPLGQQPEESEPVAASSAEETRALTAGESQTPNADESAGGASSHEAATEKIALSSHDGDTQPVPTARLGQGNAWQASPQVDSAAPPPAIPSPAAPFDPYVSPREEHHSRWSVPPPPMGATPYFGPRPGPGSGGYAGQPGGPHGPGGIPHGYGPQAPYPQTGQQGYAQPGPGNYGGQPGTPGFGVPYGPPQGPGYPYYPPRRKASGLTAARYLLTGIFVLFALFAAFNVLVMASRFGGGWSAFTSMVHAAGWAAAAYGVWSGGEALERQLEQRDRPEFRDPNRR